MISREYVSMCLYLFYSKFSRSILLRQGEKTNLKSIKPVGSCVFWPPFIYPGANYFINQKYWKQTYHHKSDYSFKLIFHDYYVIIIIRYFVLSKTNTARHCFLRLFCILKTAFQINRWCQGLMQAKSLTIIALEPLLDSLRNLVGLITLVGKVIARGLEVYSKKYPIMSMTIQKNEKRHRI